MALIIRDAPSVLGCLHLGEEMGMIAFFDPEKIMQPMLVQGLDVGSIGTQTVFGDNARERGGDGGGVWGGGVWPHAVHNRLCPCHLGSQWGRASMESLHAGLDG